MTDIVTTNNKRVCKNNIELNFLRIVLKVEVDDDDDDDDDADARRFTFDAFIIGDVGTKDAGIVSGCYCVLL